MNSEAVMPFLFLSEILEVIEDKAVSRLNISS